MKKMKNVINEKETWIINTIKELVQAGAMKNAALKADMIEYTLMCDDPETDLNVLKNKYFNIYNKVNGLQAHL